MAVPCGFNYAAQGFEIVDEQGAQVPYQITEDICDETRDVALLTRRPVFVRQFLGAKVVRASGLNFCLPAVRLMHPGLIEANGNTAAPCGMATLLETEKGGPLEIQLEKGVAGTDALKASCEERLRETTKLRGSVVFVPEIPEGSKKIDDRRKWQ